MAKKEDKNLIVGLDIGTSKVVAIVGEVEPDGQIESGRHRFASVAGPEKGVVVNIESTVQSIQQAVDEPNGWPGADSFGVYRHFRQPHSRPEFHGVTAIKNQEVTPEDVDRVIEAARVWRFRPTRRFCTSCPRNSSSTVRKAFRTRWDVRGAAGGAGPYRHRRGQRGPEHRQVRPALWTGGGRHHFAATGLQPSGAGPG
jgi:hypothetical protein